MTILLHIIRYFRKCDAWEDPFRRHQWMRRAMR